MKYPRYKRIEKLSAKLSDGDVKYIRYMRKRGFSYRKIARLFLVSCSTIFKVCLSEKELKELTKYYYLQYGKKYGITTPEQNKKNKQRKKQMYREKIKEYGKNKRELNKEYYRKYSKIYRLKNPDYFKNWIKKNIQHIREYDKNWHRRNKITKKY